MGTLILIDRLGSSHKNLAFLLSNPFEQVQDFGVVWEVVGCIGLDNEALVSRVQKDILQCLFAEGYFEPNNAYF